jgi:hypothetical protein
LWAVRYEQRWRWYRQPSVPLAVIFRVRGTRGVMHGRACDEQTVTCMALYFIRTVVFLAD